MYKRQYADSASVLLNNINAPDELTDKDFAHWCMLCGKVTDEAATGLLPIYQWQRAQQWFMKHGTPEEQAQIALYLGRAYVEDGEYDNAMQIYADALQLEMCIRDSLQCAATSGQCNDAIGQIGHHPFALVHGFCLNQSGQPCMVPSLLHHKMRDYPCHRTARLHCCI